MTPILYGRDATNFKWLGKGKLDDITSCVVYEELNGEYYMEFDYPVSGERFADLAEGGSVLVKSPSQYNSNSSARIDIQLFDIYEYSEPLDGVVHFKANHCSRRLANRIVVNNNITRLNVGDIIDGDSSYGDIGLPVTTWLTEWASGRSFGLTEPKSVLSMLVGDAESAVTELGLDWAFVNEWANNQSGDIELHVYARNPRGADNAAEIHFGYNLEDVERVRDWSGTYNCVVPYWQNAGVKKYVTDYIVYPTTVVTPSVCALMDLTNVFEEEPTESEMITYARNHLDNDTPWVGAETITANFLRGATVRDGAVVSLGDVVHVYWKDGAVDTKMRVVSYQYDVILGRYIEMTLGSISKQFVAVTGDISVSAEGTYKDLFVTAVQTNTEASISANSNKSFTATLDEEGFTPIGIVGYYIQGTGSSACNVYRMQIQNPTTAIVSIRNTRDVAATNIYLMLYVLWKRV